MAFQRLLRVSHQRYPGRVADAELADLALPEVAEHPEAVAVDQRHQRLVGHGLGAKLEVDIGDRAVDGGVYAGTCEPYQWATVQVSAYTVDVEHSEADYDTTFGGKPARQSYSQATDQCLIDYDDEGNPIQVELTYYDEEHIIVRETKQRIAIIEPKRLRTNSIEVERVATDSC